MNGNFFPPFPFFASLLIIQQTGSQITNKEQGIVNFYVPDSLFLVQHSVVRIIGVEPTWIAPPDPKSGASANFAISANGLQN